MSDHVTRETGPLDVTDVALAMGQLARDLGALSTAQEVAQEISNRTVELVPGAAHASVSFLARNRTIDTVAACDDVPFEVDQAQMRLGEGPCVDAAWEDGIVRSGDLRDDPRWPNFTQDALRCGVASMLAVQLSTDPDDERGVGALNIYGDEAFSFDERAVQIARLVAAHASVPIVAWQRVNSLKDALESRDLIGQAKGMIMQRFSVSDDAAFKVLVRLSTTTNTKLRAVAEQVVSNTLDTSLLGVLDPQEGQGA